MTDEDRELAGSRRAYGAYIREHQANVRHAFDRLFQGYVGADDATATQLAGVSAEELGDALRRAQGLVAVHDMSKWDEEEFEPYRIHFYPTSRERELVAAGALDDQEGFLHAWGRHCSVNPHHPVHWADGEGRPDRNMGLEYVIEAVCDWEAMAMRFGGTTRNWWETQAQRDRATMTPGTLATFDRMIKALFPSG